MPSEGIQIINHQKHWICVSTIGCQPGHVDIYDSLYSSLSPSALQQICNLLHTKEAKLTVRMRDIQMRHGTSDCGLFSIACAVCLCQGDNPCRLSWTQDLMRQHLTNCLSTQRMSSFPGNSRKVSAKSKQTIHIPVFCSCRMPENKMGMVRCTWCEEWFHKKCQNIPRAVFKKVLLHGFVMTVCNCNNKVFTHTKTLCKLFIQVHRILPVSAPICTHARATTRFNLSYRAQHLPGTRRSHSYG